MANGWHRQVNSGFVHRLTEGGIVGTNQNMAVDGSITPVRFSCGCHPGLMPHVLQIDTVIIAPAPFNPLVLGKDTIALNGLQYGTEVDNRIGYPINFTVKTNSDIMNIGNVVEYYEWGIAVNAIAVLITRWNVLTTQSEIRLNGDKGDHLFVDVQDDLTSLDAMHVNISGYFDSLAAQVAPL